MALVLVEPQDRQYSILESPQPDVAASSLPPDLALSLPSAMSLPVPLSMPTSDQPTTARVATDGSSAPSVLGLRGVTPVGDGNRRFEVNLGQQDLGRGQAEWELCIENMGERPLTYRLFTVTTEEVGEAGCSLKRRRGGGLPRRRVAGHGLGVLLAQLGRFAAAA